MTALFSIKIGVDSKVQSTNWSKNIYQTVNCLFFSSWKYRWYDSNSESWSKYCVAFIYQFQCQNKWVGTYRMRRLFAMNSIHIVWQISSSSSIRFNEMFWNTPDKSTGKYFFYLEIILLSIRSFSSLLSDIKKSILCWHWNSAVAKWRTILIGLLITLNLEVLAVLRMSLGVSGFLRRFSSNIASTKVKVNAQSVSRHPIKMDLSPFGGQELVGFFPAIIIIIIMIIIIIWISLRRSKLHLFSIH